MRFLATEWWPRRLGPLEVDVMNVLWTRSPANVREVSDALPRPLAYTTVMTTLDRLFKKGLLHRRKADRAFAYEPRLSRQEWERQRAGLLIADFLDRPEPARAALLSCLLEAVAQHDASLLDELQRRIKARQRQLERAAPPEQP